MAESTSSLILAGIIDDEEARLIGTEIDRNFGGGSPYRSTYESLLSGHRRFLFDVSYPDYAKARELNGILWTLLERFHLSYSFTVIQDAANGISECGIVDRELDLHATFSTRNWLFDTDQYSEGDPHLALAKRWQGFESYPKLHVIETGHDAMGLAFDPDADRKALNAYFNRYSATANAS